MDSSVQAVVVTSITTILMWGLKELSSFIKERKQKEAEKKNYDVLKDAELESSYQDIFLDINEAYPEAIVICTFGFHNGVTFFDGKHDLKMSMISERVALGVESGMRSMQNIRWKVFKRFIDPLRHENVYICHEFEGDTGADGLKHQDDIAKYHQLHGINTIVTTKLQKDDLTVGLLVMKFPKKMEFTDLQISDFVFQAKRIESIL